MNDRQDIASRFFASMIASGAVSDTISSMDEALALADTLIAREVATAADAAKASGIVEKPYWWPVLATPDEVDEQGWKYSDTWDNLKDAREDYENLADFLLEHHPEVR